MWFTVSGAAPIQGSRELLSLYSPLYVNWDYLTSIETGVVQDYFSSCFLLFSLCAIHFYDHIKVLTKVLCGRFTLVVVFFRSGSIFSTFPCESKGPLVTLNFYQNPLECSESLVRILDPDPNPDENEMKMETVSMCIVYPRSWSRFCENQNVYRKELFVFSNRRPRLGSVNTRAH